MKKYTTKICKVKKSNHTGTRKMGNGLWHLKAKTSRAKRGILNASARRWQ